MTSACYEQTWFWIRFNKIGFQLDIDVEETQFNQFSHTFSAYLRTWILVNHRQSSSTWLLNEVAANPLTGQHECLLTDFWLQWIVG